MKWISVMIISLLTNLITTEKRIFTVFRGGSRGRVQGVRTGGGGPGGPPPPPPRDDLQFSNTTGILQKKLCGLLVLK